MWWSSKPEQQTAQDDKKMQSENQQTLAGIEQLVQKINAANGHDQANAESMQRYLQRLRKEGSGR